MFEWLLLATLAVISLNFVVTIELEVVTQLNYLSALLNDTMIFAVSITSFIFFATFIIATLIAAVLGAILIPLLILLISWMALSSVHLLPLMLFLLMDSIDIVYLPLLAILTFLFATAGI